MTMICRIVTSPTTIINAEDVWEGYHAVVLDGVAREVIHTRLKRAKIVIVMTDNLVLVCDPKEKIIVRVIGGEPPDAPTSSLWAKRFPRSA
jgi:hypothetical protein